MEKLYKLSPEIAEQYKHVDGVDQVRFIFQNERIDLSIADLATADRIVSAGFPFLIKKETSKALPKAKGGK